MELKNKFPVRYNNKNGKKCIKHSYNYKFKKIIIYI